VEVYAVEIEIQSPLRPSGPSPLRSAYTRPSELIPSDEAAIKSQAAQIIGREQSPYLRASLIYKWLISSVNIQAGAFSGGVLEALQERQADSYNAALLFSALARSADIPAMPVAGVLINRHGESSLHYWVELWLDGFGWIPVDPALGAGAAPPDFNLQPDHAEFYFANMDNQRLAFSRGEVALTRMTPQGRTAGQSRSFSLQNIWEEASGGLASYSSSWSDVIITGMYVQ
jgi:transglutaminase-like putative cysteine protease